MKLIYLGCRRSILPVLWVLACLMAPIPSQGQCWKWEEIQTATVPPNIGGWMTFDGSVGKIAFLQKTGPKALAIWHYDGLDWTKSWEGEIHFDDEGNSIDLFGYYFDKNHNALVIIIWPGSITATTKLMKFDPSVGWVVIADKLPPGYPACNDFTIAFDDRRSRAVFNCLWTNPIAGYSDKTMEYDGVNFYVKSHPEFNFYDGLSAYDPVSGKVVYFGMRAGVYQNETFEYDGTAWKEVETASCPVDIHDEVSSAAEITYDSALQGILLQENVNSPALGIWLYKNGSWTEIISLAPPPARFGAAMSFDPIRNRCVLFGGETMDHELPPYALELKRLHCRPLAKP